MRRFIVLRVGSFAALLPFAPAFAQFTIEDAASLAVSLGQDRMRGSVRGALIGASIGVERWQRFDFGSRVLVAQRRNGVALSVSY